MKYLFRNNTSRRTCFKNAFKNIVLTINFNFPFYKNFKLLRELYTDVFDVILTCGPVPKSHLSVGPDIPFFEQNKDANYVWFFRYRCLAEAMEMYPGFVGYMYTNDDVIINWWNLLQFDRSKFWEGGKVDWRQETFKEIIKKRWRWWNYKQFGIVACRRFYQTLKHYSNHRDPFLENTFKTYIANGNGTARCAKGWADVYYVPGHLAQKYIDLSYIAWKSNLMSEIAVGCILRSLDKLGNVQNLKGVYLPDLNIHSIKAFNLWKIYNLNQTFIHPVKFNTKDSILTKNLFQSFLLSYKKMLIDC